MRTGSARVVLTVAAAAASFLLGCQLPSAPGAVAGPGVNNGAARTLLPGTSTPAAALLLSQSAAFAILGHSCGGIQEKAYATDFDSATGLPSGDVYIQTRCGGSGRGGGYHTTTYSAWVGATWDFSGSLVSSARLSAAPTVDPALAVTDAYGDSLFNINNVAYLVVPAATAPSAVTVGQSGDQFQVSWTTNGANPTAITSSTLTATPDDPTASVLTVIVSGTDTTGLVGPLQPETTYQVTVTSTTIGGTGPASDPVGVTTAAASIPPSAPTDVNASWTVQDPVGSTDTMVVTWSASDPGDSPVDQYQVTITGSDGAGTFTQTVSGTTFEADFAVDFGPDWSVTVAAHNAVGWSPWSDPVTLGGL